jgi:hypothetical protein
VTPAIDIDLADVAELLPVSVVCAVVEVGGREGLRVYLHPEIEQQGVAGVDFVDQPTLVLVGPEFSNGTVSVDVFSAIRPGAPELARGFAGLAFRVTGDLGAFESVYLRPLNGARENPPAERAARAVQYFAYPQWPFDRLRAERPGGGYESAADIGLETWHTLEIAFDDTGVTAAVDGVRVIRSPLLSPARSGRVGLFVDIGTDAVFSRLRVTPSGEPVGH